ncbi:hypothetical protein [Nannocystis punicea]|uniref:Uncharacterized protein n=1 Tax=Nannocystis punicea TaxID=2995304 RepID=A0ABY7GRY3_9BACT|nr:hypothetical protein [Nannocystis poenicansa]WAS89726.1 hypothetical protein O0S08_26335 [Nannocystis poenicansa]
MKLSTLLCGAVFLAGAMIGVSSVNAAPRAQSDLSGGRETQEDEPCCIMLLTTHHCIVGDICGCNCSISGTSGAVAEEEEEEVALVKPLRLPFGI